MRVWKILGALLALFALGAFAPSASAQGVNTQCIVNVAAQGTADAITSVALPCQTTTNLVLLTTAAANATTAPTYQPLGSPALPITRANGKPLLVGDLQPGFVAMLASTGTSWVLLNPTVAFSGGSISVEDYGAVCDGVTDDTTAFNSAAAAALAAHVPLTIPGASCKVGGSADVTFSGITVTGNPSAFGITTPFATSAFTLLLNPAHSIVLGNNTVLEGMHIVRQGLTVPSSLRTALDALKAYSGTALKIGLASTDANDIQVSDVTIDGFTQAMTTAQARSVSRVTLHNIAGDNTNHLQMTNCIDICNIDNQFAEPRVTYLGPGVLPTFQISAISTITNAGGTVQVNLTGTPATIIQSGDSVVVYGVTGAGASGVNGRWTATYVSNTQFKLNGSTFSGTPSGGNVELGSAYRSGIAFNMTGQNIGGELMHNLLEYGYATSLFIGVNHGPVDCFECWFDGDNLNGAYGDPSTIGINYQGLEGSFHGGFMGVKGTSILVNTNTTRPFTVDGATWGATSCKAGVVGAAAQVLAGSVSFVGANIVGGNICANPVYFYIADGANYVTVSGSFFDNAARSSAFAFQTTATDCPKLIIDGVVGPCPFTPTLSGSATAGTWSYGTQLGEYTITSGGFGGPTLGYGGRVVNIWWQVAGVGYGGGAAGQLLMTATGAPSATSMPMDASCVYSRLGGFTASANYNTLTLQLTKGTNLVAVEQNSTTGFAVAAAQVSNFANGTTEIEGSCTYYQ